MGHWPMAMTIEGQQTCKGQCVGLLDVPSLHTICVEHAECAVQVLLSTAVTVLNRQDVQRESYPAQL